MTVHRERSGPVTLSSRTFANGHFIASRRWSIELLWREGVCGGAFRAWSAREALGDFSFAARNKEGESPGLCQRTVHHAAAYIPKRISPNMDRSRSNGSRAEVITHDFGVAGIKEAVAKRFTVATERFEAPVRTTPTF